LAQNTDGNSFSISKSDDDYGFLRYTPDTEAPIEQWQTRLLQTIADNIAVSIRLEKKRSQEALIGLQEERAVIARELHDSLAQSLSYLTVQTSVLSKQLTRELPRARIDDTIADIRDGLSDAYRQLRELLTTFRLQVSDPSLKSALKATAIEFTHKCGHPVNLKFALSADALSPNEQIHVLQIVREALSNIQRHAQASSAEIIVSRCADRTNVGITDNGKGLSDQPTVNTQYGLLIMNERAESLGAQLEITSASGTGTKVNLEFVSSTVKPAIAI
jgi:two-component system nitrate/nitrite sensor histidine kinase NarX